ncbi:MAG: C45 family peptidase [Acidimicrobiia bacterium]|nr:C45 family peptidase [Acidimicrobiia bacterium]
MFGGKLRVLEVYGDSGDFGRAHGATCRDMIRKYLETRIELTYQEPWSGGVVDRDLILETAEETLPHHEAYSPSLYAEMVAMAHEAGITPAEAVVVGGFTDLVDVVRARVGSGPVEHNCSAVINPIGGFVAQTWDMHASAGEFVIMLKLDPLAGPDMVIQTTAGCLGQIGINEAGIAVGINNLTSMGKPGVTWNFVVRKALEQATLDAAVKVILDAELAGGHNFLLMGPDGEGANVEAMPGHKQVTRVRDKPFVHTNHCLDPVTASEHADRLQVHVDDSIERLRLSQLHAGDLEAFFGHERISRRVQSHDEVGTCGAVIMEPTERRMRSVWGIPGDNPWETFQL